MRAAHAAAVDIRRVHKVAAAVEKHVEHTLAFIGVDGTPEWKPAHAQPRHLEVSIS